MKLKPVTSIPGRKPVNDNLSMVLKEFMNMDCGIVEIDAIKEGYKHANSLMTSLYKTIKRSEYTERVKAVQRAGKVYLTKISPIDEV